MAPIDTRCLIVLYILSSLEENCLIMVSWCYLLLLTDEPEDVSDGGNKDDQHVVKGQDGSSNQHVASPAELSTTEQQCGDGRANLE